jgi:RNA polymerase sigma factor (sigma-70 family)
MPQGIPSRGSQHQTSSDLTNLARAALEGSTDDGGAFLKACWQYAYDAAIRFGRKHHGAEDSAQEALMAVDRLLKLEPPELDPESVGALVRTVVLRHVNEVARRRLLEAKAIQEASAPRREAPDAPREVETEEWARPVRAAIETLPQPLRRLIELRHWDGLSTREIAREVGSSHTSIVRLLREAEDTLRAALRAENPTASTTSSGDTTLADDGSRP